MNYQECLDFLYYQLPYYQNQGKAALKYDLSNICKLCAALGNPQSGLQCVHVAGTNGKGSTCHALAAIYQTAGYKVGLYTSPHLKDYRERIRINGVMIPEHQVVQFVSEHKALILELKASFFEITVALAFDYFASEKVELAIIEVGLGGRLDSTNIIQPLLSVITNIGYDHQAILGNTLSQIAHEKAGIIKENTPVVLGEVLPETEVIFKTFSQKLNAPLSYSHSRFKLRVLSTSPHLLFEVYDRGVLRFDALQLDVQGLYQGQNIPIVLNSIEILHNLGYKVSDEHIVQGYQQITSLTGLKGRWQQLANRPLTICDTGHNPAAFEYILSQLLNLQFERLHMVLGFVRDKDCTAMLKLLPKTALYYFCSAGMPRSLPAQELHTLAQQFQLQGEVIEDPNSALAKARINSGEKDLIFIGGSTFVVAALNDL